MSDNPENASPRKWPHVEIQSLKFADIVPVADELAHRVSEDEETMGALLLLLCFVAYSRDKSAGEYVYVEMQSRLMPYLTCTVDAANEFVMGMIERARE